MSRTQRCAAGAASVEEAEERSRAGEPERSRAGGSCSWRPPTGALPAPAPQSIAACRAHAESGNINPPCETHGTGVQSLQALTERFGRGGDTGGAYTWDLLAGSDSEPACCVSVVCCQCVRKRRGNSDRDRRLSRSQTRTSLVFKFFFAPRPTSPSLLVTKPFRGDGFRVPRRSGWRRGMSTVPPREARTRPGQAACKSRLGVPRGCTG